MPRHVCQEDGKVHGVVIGVRRHDGRWLMVRRSQYVAFPGKVCFPGGGIEAGESQQEACIREMNEELGVTVRPVRHVWRHEFPDKPLVLWGWLAEMAGDGFAPDPLEIDEVMWLSRSEAVGHPDGLPTNGAFIDSLEAAFFGNENVAR